MFPLQIIKIKHETTKSFSIRLYNIRSIISMGCYNELVSR